MMEMIVKIRESMNTTHMGARALCGADICVVDGSSSGGHAMGVLA